MLLGAGTPSLLLAYRVFPGLQDKLSVFPNATIYNRIVKDWPGLRPQLALFKTPDLYRKLGQLYGAYVLALSKGAKRYELSDRNVPFKTVSFIIDQTGIDRQTVVAFLSSLERLAKEGSIDLQFWDPKKAIELNKAVTKQKKAVEATKPQGVIEETAAKATKALTWVAVIAVVVGGGYALSQAKHFLPKSRGK